MSEQVASRVLLENLLNTQQEILRTMVTKDDLWEHEKRTCIITRDHELRIAALETTAHKMPAWFWPTIIPIGTAAVACFGSVVVFIATHLSSIGGVINYIEKASKTF